MGLEPATRRVYEITIIIALALEATACSEQRAKRKEVSPHALPNSKPDHPALGVGSGCIDHYLGGQVNLTGDSTLAADDLKRLQPGNYR